MTEAPDRRLGRPPASSSSETRLRILDAARRCFAELGYEMTTNRVLATKAGLTTGAIYHYFGSKADLFLAAHAEVQSLVYARFEHAIEGFDTFSEQMGAVLDAALELQRLDPSLALFLVTVRTDVPRHAELKLAQPSRQREFFGRIVDDGIATGELNPDDRAVVLDTLTAMLLGLTVASADDPERHRRAMEGMKALLSGLLIRSPVGI